MLLAYVTDILSREQIQNARENPLAAAAAAAAVSGKAPATQNAENLLDIDFDGAAPASVQEKPSNGLSGLEGLAGTPQGGTPARVASPAQPGPSTANNMDDLLGVFGNGHSGAAAGGMSNDDILNGFSNMDVSGGNQPPPPGQQMGGGGKKTNEDLLSLF